MAVAKKGTVPDSVPGIAGVVPDSIVPGMVGFEAGQAAVGDLFAWCARLLGRSHEELNGEAAKLRPGASGLVALDWHNGNRCVLMDPALSGVVVGLSLHTTPAELYRAMLEATAFGAKVILQQMETAGVPVRRLLACGGIAQKSPLLLQILADVLDRQLVVAEAAQACALGAALLGAVAAGRFADVGAAQRVLVREPRVRYAPRPANVVPYARA
jgi:L-ribulokinase